MNRVRLFASTLLPLAAASALAGVIPYPNPGTVAPQTTTYASSSSGIQIYSLGSTANYTDYVNVFDLQTGYSSGDILDNHTSTPGFEITVGAGAGEINVGDQLVFDIDSPEGSFSSIAAYSVDKTNHAYITVYAGGTLNGVTIPLGLFVGMEDQSVTRSDLDYNDDTFVFAGVTAPGITNGVTPEPCSLLLLGTGLVGISGTARERLRRRS